MDDGARKQVIEALAEMIYETTHLSPLEDDGSHKCVISKDTLAAAREALTALKAIQPRPDVVVAAREAARMLSQAETRAEVEWREDKAIEFRLARYSLEAALADEHEWEVMHGAFVDGDLVPVSPEYPGAFPIHVPKSVLPKPPVSREKAIEDAARRLIIDMEDPEAPNEAVAEDTRELKAALSREVQP